MRKFNFVILYFLGLLLVSFPTSYGVPTFWGSTGLIGVPNGYVLGANQMELGAFSGDSERTYVFNFGFKENFEAGLAILNPLKTGPIESLKFTGTRTTLNLKGQIMKGTAVSPALSLGLKDLTNQTATGFGGYVVFSQPVPLTGIKFHLGLLREQGKTGAFGASELPLTRSLRLLLETDRETYNVGLRITLDEIIPGSFTLSFLDWEKSRHFIWGTSFITPF